ncbi:Protein of unknown function [Pyronema omphalodes CBS 100304]|uniref:Uncharacterized protein n=1 Tax=Pyronema omphalodes (strain CBS 100304) TaxID=1076935 RepID=U4LC51_PYROM|nr:Protein of unknown function [Pyronema omphalodes CBS 100304]
MVSETRVNSRVNPCSLTRIDGNGSTVTLF